jgi:hypothetical protein
LRFAIEHRQRPDNRNSEILNRNSFYRRVPPGERDLTSSDGDPGTNGVTSKTRCEGQNKACIEHFASIGWVRTSTSSSYLQSVGKSQREVKALKNGWSYRAQVTPA